MSRSALLLIAGSAVALLATVLGGERHDYPAYLEQWRLVLAGLDLGDKFGAIGATAMTKAAGLNHIPQGGTLYTFRLGGS